MTRRLLPWFSVAVLLLGSQAARADEAPPNDPPVRVTTLMLKHTTVDDQAIAPLLRAFDEALKKNTRLDNRDVETRLEEFSQEKPVEQIESSRAALADGSKALAAMDYPTAIKRLQVAIDGLAQVLPYIKKQELADAMCSLGVAYAQSGDKKAAKEAFQRVLVWRPDHQFDTARYPTAVLPAFEEARKGLDKAKRGSLEIRSEPLGAQAFVDGKFIGVTPAIAEALVVGEHWVTFKKEGFRKSVLAGSVSPKYQQTVTAVLDHSQKFLIVEQALNALEKSMGSERLDETSDNLKDTLLIDHGVFIRMTPATAGNPAGSINVETWLYDLRTRQKIKAASRVVKPESVATDVRGIVDTLYAKISYDAELVAPKEAEPPKQKKRTPIYKAWWLWTIVGVGIGGVIAAGILVPRPKNCGGGNYCPGITF